MKIQESGEMYLETILILLRKMTDVRAIDVSEYMGYSKPSVSRAMGILRREKMIEVDVNGYITLTEKGMSVAKKIFEKHCLLTEFFVSIGVDEETATEDACRIEHVISDKSFDKIKEFVEKLSK